MQEIQETVQRLKKLQQDWIDSDSAKPLETQDSTSPPKPEIQMPIWPEPQRAMPNAMLRSALFSAARRRRQVKREQLAAWGRTEILLTGETFNQADEGVWLQLVHLYRTQCEPADCKVRFSAKPFLRELGSKRPGGSNVNRLLDSIARLGATVHIKHQGYEYGGGLVDDYTLDQHSGLFVVRLNPKYLQLFGTGHTRIDWETRKALPTGLPSWLHRDVLSQKATEKHPHRELVKNLQTRCGMKGPLKEFRRSLRSAMQKLEAAGIVERWTITRNDALEYVRP